MSESPFDGAFEEKEQFGEAPEFPDELVEPLQEFAVVGHLSETFTYGGQEFVIRTLSIGEELEALRAVQKYENLQSAGGRVYATAMVAAAVQSFNGQPLVVPVSPKQDIASLKLAKVLEWFWPTIERLYYRYVELERQQKEVLDGLRSTLEGDQSQEPTDPVG